MIRNLVFVNYATSRSYDGNFDNNSVNFRFNDYSYFTQKYSKLFFFCKWDVFSRQKYLQTSQVSFIRMCTYIQYKLSLFLLNISSFDTSISDELSLVLLHTSFVLFLWNISHDFSISFITSFSMTQFIWCPSLLTRRKFIFY